VRYIEVLEAVQRSKDASAQARADAREQLALADKKRADAARRYQDQLNSARGAAAAARKKLQASNSKAQRHSYMECIDAALAEGRRSYPLRDRTGRLLGWIEAVGRLLQAKDRHGTIIGWYDPRQNVTRDRTGTLVGTGDLLSAMLVCGR
jgi:hypothetical protein